MASNGDNFLEIWLQELNKDEHSKNLKPVENKSQSSSFMIEDLLADRMKNTEHNSSEHNSNVQSDTLNQTLKDFLQKIKFDNAISNNNNTNLNPNPNTFLGNFAQLQANQNSNDDLKSQAEKLAQSINQNLLNLAIMGNFGQLDNSQNSGNVLGGIGLPSTLMSNSTLPNLQNTYANLNPNGKRNKRKARTAFTPFQLSQLENRFTVQKYLTPIDRDEIANNLKLNPAQVITWFQNRRAKMKRETGISAV